jgi:hypothetical protein
VIRFFFCCDSFLRAACAARLQSFDPHVVIKPFPNGTCTKAYQTDSPLLQQLPAKPRGNTQAVLLPAAVSGEADDCYIGIVHVEVQRSYTNYFYKMQVSCITAGIGIWGKHEVAAAGF